MSEYPRRDISAALGGAGLTERGEVLLRQIAEAVGVEDLDVDDEHARWWVYWDAVPREDLRVPLKEITGAGEQLSRQVVVEVLRHVDEAEGRTWVAGGRGGLDEYAWLAPVRTGNLGRVTPAFRAVASRDA